MISIYKHTGNGHYVGSCIIVLARSIQTAERLIKDELDKHGLLNEQLNIEKIDIEENKLIHVDSGDY